jgi:peptidyl-prolyl cis-trans isomerase SurA
MFKKKIFFILLFLLIFNLTNTNSNINIVLKINNEIITNNDIKKEIGYLKTLNPNLKKLNDEQILEISKQSLINEVIKKKEINKFFGNIDNKDEIIEQYLNDLVLRSNLKDINELNKQLILNNSYSINEIKKKIEIDLLWNELIVLKYKNQVYVDKEKILKQLDVTSTQHETEYFLSEIVFTKKENTTIEESISQIKLSIKEIGFENTANIFSISASSKYGGRIGWLSKSSLSNKISEKLINKKAGDVSDPVQIGNTYLILKIEDIRNKKIMFDKEEELQRLSNAEINKQLSKFSRIYFNKSKKNYTISDL